MVQIAHRLRGNLWRGETVVVAQCFQPAVSRISNPEAWEQFERSNHVERLPTGSRRYSRPDSFDELFPLSFPNLPNHEVLATSLSGITILFITQSIE
jgi:hypothetical protein